ncbi:MAG: M23 family metallopeptidase [Eubacteriales bacterium]
MAKKILGIILAVLLVLLPSIACAVIYFIPEDIVQTPLNISGTFYDGGNVNFEFNRNKNSFLASFFDELYENSTPSTFEADKIRYDKIYFATVTDKDKTENLTLYLSERRSCYFVNGEGELFLINTQYANSLLNESFVISLYEELYTPTLLTHSNVPVLPTSTNFKYTIKDGSSKEGDGIPTASGGVEYFSSNTSKFTFSTQPDICNVSVYVGDELKYSGALYGLDSDALPKNATVRYEIEATWVKSTENDCFGTATYSFYISHAPAPVFSIENTSVNAGEFVLVKASNILDSSRISCSFSKELDIEPRFFKNGNDYYALIPFSPELKDGTYRLTLECGETKKAFDISIKEREQKIQKVESDASSALTDKAIYDMQTLMSSIGNRCSNELFGSEGFVNYEESFSIRLGFAHLREFSDGTQYLLDGVDFYSTEGFDIPAISSGIVCASGEDAILGKYIVVDHGYGLKSWYCNISETSLSVGNTVHKGDIIAKTGSSDFYSQTGFYLITTVLDTPVAPYALYENNFSLPEIKN